MSGLASGQVLHLGRAASPQFTGDGIRLRLIRVHDVPTNEDGWAWVEGYQLDDDGLATELRSVYVRLAGVRSLRDGH